MTLPPQDPRDPDDFEGQDKDLVHFQEPSNQYIVPSVHGKIIQSDFFLDIKCQIEGCVCCMVHPTATTPVQVYAGALKKKPQPVQPPPNWNPQPMQPTNLVITIRTRPDGGQDIIIDTPSQMPQQTQPQMVNTNMPGPNMNIH